SNYRSWFIKGRRIRAAVVWETACAPRSGVGPARPLGMASGEFRTGRDGSRAVTFEGWDATVGPLGARDSAGLESSGTFRTGPEQSPALGKFWAKPSLMRPPSVPVAASAGASDRGGAVRSGSASSAPAKSYSPTCA